MGITFKSSINFEVKVKEILAKKKELLGQALEEVATEIVQRTQSGKEIEGKGFAPYSDGYKKHRISEGESTTPNLTKTGQMLGSITSEVQEAPEGLKGRIFLTGFNAAKAGWNQKLRPFFGFSKKQRQELVQQLKK